MPSSLLPILVSKFGGTSVGTPERVQEVVRLVAANGGYRKVVVTSAFGGVTDRLLQAVSEAKNPEGDYKSILKALRKLHKTAVKELALKEEQKELNNLLDSFWDEIRDMLDGVRRRQASDARTMDAIVSAGERSSVPIIAAAFRAANVPALALDTRPLIRTDATHGEAVVDFETTNIQLQDAYKTIPEDTIAVVTGFIAATESGATTTLGRSGSDYTATILANALGAEECVIWTDVDGVLSADPRLVPEAFTLPDLSYEEAGELAHFGAKVLHPRTMRPLQEKGIPLRIKNTMRPDHPGTVIGPARKMTEHRIKAITSVRDVALLRLVGTGVLGAPDLTARAFSSLAEAGIDVLLIAQASSEGSLCFAVKGARANDTVELLSKTFEKERERGTLRLLIEPENAVIAAVGDFMRDAPGLAGRMFATLGRADVNVRAIAQGASEHNISAVITDEDAALAVQALHESFALRRTRAHLAVIGTGGLGKQLLELLFSQTSSLRNDHRLNLRLVGVANSTQAVFEKEGIQMEGALSQLGQAPPTELSHFIDQLISARLERRIVIDATPSEEVASYHAELLKAGIAVVTPNKAATLVNGTEWKKAQSSAISGEVPYLYETTVGAGLGIIAILRDLIRTGDELHRIEGVLSGTLSYVFNAMRNGTSFSEAVLSAREKGYTEPDPRDDLSGRDVARKLVLLGREMGLDATLEDVRREPLLPEEMFSISLEEFLERLPELNDDWRTRFETESADIHYIARLDASGTLSASVEPVKPNTPFAGLRGPALSIAFYTNRYSPEPFVIRGPGASTDITAAVLLADIVRAAEAM